MTVSTKLTRTALAATAALLAANPAFAHHAMGGVLPSTFGQGLISGLAHPVIGIDHLAFVIGVGLLAALTPLRFVLPLAFVGGTLGGAFLHLASLNLPGAELFILGSVLLMGVAILKQTRLDPKLMGAAFAAAGLFHGYAYAESIVGAETGVLGAYLLGFSAIQYAIAIGAGLAATWLTATRGEAGLTVQRVAAGAMLGVVLTGASSMVFVV